MIVSSVNRGKSRLQDHSRIVKYASCDSRPTSAIRAYISIHYNQALEYPGGQHLMSVHDLNSADGLVVSICEVKTGCCWNPSLCRSVPHCCGREAAHPYLCVPESRKTTAGSGLGRSGVYVERNVCRSR